MQLNQLHKGVALVFVSAILTCFGQYFWKLGTTAPVYLLCGFLLYGVAMGLLMLAYRYGRMSVLQPILSISYVFSIFIGKYWLNESVGPVKCLGIAIIIAGVTVLASEKE